MTDPIQRSARRHRRIERLVILLTALVLGSVFVLAGCGSARRSEPIAGPFHAATPQIERGERAFMQYCNPCHTGGEASFAPALNNKPAPGFLIKLQVRAGLGAMPRFPKSVISPHELDNIVAYLKALRHHAPPASRSAEAS
jgi:mono/diheme cytochrome c family protein